MSIKLADFLIPAGGSTEFLIEDKYIRGGLHLVPTFADLALMDSTTLKGGMITIVQTSLKAYQLSADKTTWAEWSPGSGTGEGGFTPVRQTVAASTPVLLPEQAYEVALPLGKTILVFKLEVDTSCHVEAFETAARDDTNPYTFIATADHLIDDGSTLMSDGTVLRGRRYTILTNQENVGDATTDINIYFRVTNTDVVDKGINLTISFLPIEPI